MAAGNYPSQLEISKTGDGLQSGGVGGGGWREEHFISREVHRGAQVSPVTWLHIKHSSRRNAGLVEGAFWYSFLSPSF